MALSPPKLVSSKPCASMFTWRLVFTSSPGLTSTFDATQIPLSISTLVRLVVGASYFSFAKFPIFVKFIVLLFIIFFVSVFVCISVVPVISVASAQIRAVQYQSHVVQLVFFIQLFYLSRRPARATKMVRSAMRLEMVASAIMPTGTLSTTI